MEEIQKRNGGRQLSENTQRIIQIFILKNEYREDSGRMEEWEGPGICLSTETKLY